MSWPFGQLPCVQASRPARLHNQGLTKSLILLHGSSGLDVTPVTDSFNSINCLNCPCGHGFIRDMFSGVLRCPDCGVVQPRKDML